MDPTGPEPELERSAHHAIGVRSGRGCHDTQSQAADEPSSTGCSLASGYVERPHVRAPNNGAQLCWKWDTVLTVRAGVAAQEERR